MARELNPVDWIRVAAAALGVLFAALVWWPATFAALAFVLWRFADVIETPVMVESPPEVERPEEVES